MRRQFLTVVGVAATWAVMLWGPAYAQTYPNKPIKAIVPFAAGSATDQIGRAFAAKMSETLGQPIVVENRAGVNGMLGADAVAKAPADGYTLLIGTNSTNAALKSLMKKLPYDQDTAFAPVGYLCSVPLIVAINNDVPAKTLREFVDLAKAKPNEMTFASASTSQLVSSEMLASMAGIQMTNVPYKSGPAAMTDLLGGQVDIFLAPFGKSYEDYQKQGKLKVLAMLNNERLDSVKEYPAINESKALKNFAFNIWTGYFVKKDTPEPIVQVVHKAVTDALNDPAVRSGLEANSLLVAKPLTLQAAGKAYADGTAQFRAIVKSINLQPQ
jgi:tripartite-type tricarboxylate transporter receptor subunit TctC